MGIARYQIAVRAEAMGSRSGNGMIPLGVMGSSHGLDLWVMAKLALAENRAVATLEMTSGEFSVNRHEGSLPGCPGSRL